MIPLPIDWATYQYKLNINGLTHRERLLNDAQSYYSDAIADNPACKKFIRESDKAEVMLTLTDSANIYKKTYAGIPHSKTRIQIGDVLHWEDTHWLVTEVNISNEMYQRGSIERCNHLLAFQTFDKKIHKYWCILENPYSKVYTEARVISTPFNQLKMYISYDENTRQFYKDKRFVIENGFDADGKEIPIVFRITNTQGATSNYDGNLMTVFLEADNHTVNDNMELLIADYVDPDKYDPTLLRCEIDGSKQLLINSTYTFTSQFFGSWNQEVTDSVDIVWELVDEVPGIQLSYTHNTCSVHIPKDHKLYGIKFSIKCYETSGKYAPAYHNLKVVSLV